MDFQINFKDTLTTEVKEVDNFVYEQGLIFLKDNKGGLIAVINKDELSSIVRI